MSLLPVMSDTLQLKKLLPKKACKYSLLFFILFPYFAYAQAVGPVPDAWCQFWGIRCGGISPANTLWSMLWSVITIALSFISVVAAGFLVYYGFLYVMSRGEEDNARRAKAGIAYALLGVMIAGLAAWLVNSIINI